MTNQRNTSGKQLSSSSWLTDHHVAKEKLRKSFAKKLTVLEPTSIVDIGCGTGLWLTILNDVFPKNCKFIGVDSDKSSLETAEQISQSWGRECEWIQLDINTHPEKIPVADMALIFNFSSYVDDLDMLLSYISKERGFKQLALRQFAGHEIKFGPFENDDQTAIDLSLKDAIGNSEQIRYYDMDRLIQAAATTNRQVLFKEFELFQDFSPFKSNTWPYIKGTAEWTAEKMPANQKKLITDWLSKAAEENDSLYFYSLDWTALLF
ncbi:class I SAM-dependent methyltransferase [Vagococcus coleopterorum]|uniref:Class I SAM-dependent methyltransferase n=1 Tax=Vagococcus coleopterorum TaxID=2714946 RepID=A0A6G8AKK5_9ENTE|nr:class I SAM-dependent methyltransferase [Vagococcus coleopterorum]QIL45601.1 class I SAM-dependent methyltransferase [Vagococcus coleopterorum]